jgi:hypothetical protein
MRHRKITYEAVATSRFREYLPEQVWAGPSSVTRRSAPFVVDVPSTAAPVAPSVVQVLPTFAWKHDVPEGSGTQSVRRGGGLRVYLEPPWFSSGEGELLGVVLRPAEVTEPRDDRMTRWGMDPIWDGGTPTKWPNLADAVNAASTARGLRLRPGGPQVDVAGYPVAWDDERKLWRATSPWMCAGRTRRSSGWRWSGGSPARCQASSCHRSCWPSSPSPHPTAC